MLTTLHPAPAETPSLDLPAIPTAWRIFTTEDGLPHNSIRAITVFGDDLWVGTDNGLARYSQGEWAQWASHGGAFPTGRITAIDVDLQTHDVWLGTWGDGLLRFTAGRFDQFDQLSSGLAGNLVFAIKVIEGRIWAATNGGLSSYNPRGNSWDLHFPRTTERQFVAVTTLAQIGRQMYLGTWGSGIIALESGPGAKVHVRRGFDAFGSDLVITDIVSVAGDRWWLTQQGVYTGDPFNVYRTVVPDRDGLMNLASDKTDPSTGGESTEYVYSAAAAPDARLWIGTEEGVRLLADTTSPTWIGFSRQDSSGAGWALAKRGEEVVDKRWLNTGPPVCRVRCLAADNERVWLGTAEGLALGTDFRPWKALPSDGKRIEADKGNTGAEYVAPSGPCPTGPAVNKRRQPGPGLALFGPQSRTIALPGRPDAEQDWPVADLLAFELAVEAANKRVAAGQSTRVPSGHRDAWRPEEFRAVIQESGYTHYGWSLPEDAIAAFAKDQSVLGLVGFVHPAEQMANAAICRSEVPLVSTYVPAEWRFGPGSFNPWVFRCWGNEPRRHRALIDHLIEDLGYTRLAVVLTTDQTRRAPFTWWSDHLRRRTDSQLTLVHVDPAPHELEGRLKALQASAPQAILTWCDAPMAANVLRRLRELAMKQLFVGGPSLLEKRFLELAGPAPGAVAAVCPGTANPCTDRTDKRSRTYASAEGEHPWSQFSAQYAERNVVGAIPVPPDQDACQTFAATDHLIAAVKASNGDRESVRRALETMRASATGEEHYERLGPHVALTIARLEDGAWVQVTIDGR